MEDISCTTENRQWRTAAGRVAPESEAKSKIPVQRVQKKIEFPHILHSLHRKPCDPQSDARSSTRPSKSKILSIKPPELGRSNVSGTRFERPSLPPRSSSNGDAGGKPIDANVRRACKVRETSRAKSIRRNEEQLDCDSVEQHASVQDLRAHAQPKQKRTRDQQDKERETQQIRSRDGGCRGHTPSRDFNHREGDSQEPYILAEGNRHTEHEQRHGSARHKGYLNVKSFQRTVSVMMRRATVQITNVSNRNAAALVEIDQFL